ncbi:hypothetical protein V1512DRAFT_231306 [Lipomyces arxii]|uniref:uncharacterized protein n=1 Tax=Lipomyces arxii TaxID=56418 RepID=UPI0034CF7065
MAFTLTDRQINEIEKVFSLFDYNHDGQLDTKYLGTAMRSLGLSPSDIELASMIAEVDIDNHFTIDYSEFVVLVLRKMNDTNLAKETKEAFEEYDANGAGYISKDQVYNLLKELPPPGITSDEMNDIMREAFQENEDKLDYNLFVDKMLAKYINID